MAEMSSLKYEKVSVFHNHSGFFLSCGESRKQLLQGWLHTAIFGGPRQKITAAKGKRDNIFGLGSKTCSYAALSDRFKNRSKIGCDKILTVSESWDDRITVGLLSSAVMMMSHFFYCALMLIHVRRFCLRLSHPS